MKLLTPLKSVIPCLFLSALAFALPLEPTPAPADARVYFISPSDGDRVQAPFTVKFGVDNMQVVPEGVNIEGTGHHHLSVDGRLRVNPHEPLGREVIHLDKGQTQIDLFLTPGKHVLQIIFADYLHRPFEPSIVSETITITVSSD